MSKTPGPTACRKPSKRHQSREEVYWAVCWCLPRGGEPPPTPPGLASLGPSFEPSVACQLGGGLEASPSKEDGSELILALLGTWTSLVWPTANQARGVWGTTPRNARLTLYHDNHVRMPSFLGGAPLRSGLRMRCKPV
jgi:hypothetical protein